MAGHAAAWTERSGWLKLRWKGGGGGEGSSEDLSNRCGDVIVWEARWITEGHYQEIWSGRSRLRPASSLLRSEGEGPSSHRLEKVRQVEMWWGTQIKTTVRAVFWPTVPPVAQTRSLDVILTTPHPTRLIQISLLLPPNVFAFPLFSTSSTTLKKARPSFAWTVKDFHLIFLLPCWLPSFPVSILQPEGLFLITDMIILQPAKVFHGSEDKVAVSNECCWTPMHSSSVVSSSRCFFMVFWPPFSPTAHHTVPSSCDCICLCLEHSSFLLLST